MSVTAWYFVRTGPGDLAAIPRSSVEAFVFRDGTLTASTDGFVRYAEVHIEVVDRRPVRVLRTGFFQSRVGGDGLRDPEHEMQTMAAVAGMLSGTERLPTGMVNAEAAFAKRRYDHLNTWQPSEDDLTKLRELVNSKARRELM